MKHFPGARLPFSVELVHELIFGSHLLVLDLLDFKLGLPFIFLLFPLLSEELHFLNKVTGDLLLVGGHLLFQLLNFTGLLIQLFFHLKEDSLAFLALCLLLRNLCESNSELFTEG